MEGAGYYTGMMNETQDINGAEWDGIGSPPEEQQETTPIAKGSNNRRNKNFSENEDVLVVKAWRNTSIDPIPGTNQKRAPYRTRVHEYYMSEKDVAKDRSPNSLNHRWTTIQESVNKFCGSFAAIESRNQSGKTFENKLMDAHKLYKAEDKDNKSFQLLHCWHVLRHEPKWHERMAQLAGNKTSQKKNKAPADPIIDLTANPHDDQEHVDNNDKEPDIPKRPIGRKKAKQISRQSGVDEYNEAFDNMWEKKKIADEYKEAQREAKKDERFQKSLELEKEMVQIKKDQSNLKLWLEEERIMTMDITGLPVEQQLYYRSLRVRYSLVEGSTVSSDVF